MRNLSKTYPLVIFHEIRWQKSSDLITSTVFQIQKFEKNWQENVHIGMENDFLTVLSYSMDEIMKMYGGIFLCSNPLGSYEQS